VTNAGKVVVKGFQIIKSNASNIGKLVFSRYIKPELVNNCRGQFPKAQILQWIFKILNEDKEHAAIRFKVKDAELYKNDTQLQKVIALDERYGVGQHMLIRVRQAHPYGTGKNKNYVGTQFKEHIKPWDIVLDKTIKEMYPFITDTQTELDRWIKA
jgi:hypothetical protein